MLAKYTNRIGCVISTSSLLSMTIVHNTAADAAMNLLIILPGIFGLVLTDSAESGQTKIKSEAWKITYGL